MKYCSSCGGDLEQRVPSGDNRERAVCRSCGTVFYQNPKVVGGCVPEWQGRVLLCRRAIEPRLGYWTLPAGFMENGETTLDCAARETLEEACARMRIEGLFAVFDLPVIDQVYMIYRGSIVDGDFAAGEETLEAELFDEKDIPWDELAFPVMIETLRLYFRDIENGSFGTHVGSIVRERGSGYRHYRVEMLRG